MGRIKEKFLVLDTETTGEIPQQIAYDVGGLVCDRDGKVYYRFHYLVREVFTNPVMMASAYYAAKCPEYFDRLVDHEVELLPFSDILRKLTAIIDLYGVDTIAAYNLQFDERAMANTCNLLYDNRNWLNRDLRRFCIWRAACEVLYKKKYIRTAFAHDWLTDKGNIKTSAETGYRYISGDMDFEEEHRGLDDCEIEAQLMAAVFRQHQKFDPTPKGFPMRVVFNRVKDMEI